MNFALLTQNCDSMIRAGNVYEARKSLAQLDVAKVPRQWRLPLARLCRRAGLNGGGLRLLTRIVRPARAKNQSTATEEERAEYAALLVREHAFTEALGILQSLDGAKVPDANLFRAFVFFSQFKFKSAISVLDQYVESKVTDYARLVGNVNLAYALVSAGQTERAHGLLTKAAEIAKGNGQNLLAANCHALFAQIHLHDSEYAKAIEECDVGLRLLDTGGTNYRIFCLKWRAFAEGLTRGSAEPIKEFRRLALENGDWDAAREADFQTCKVEFDSEVFAHLYFGTPFTDFREKCRNELKHFPKHETYAYGSSSGALLDLESGCLDGEPLLRTGRSGHQLLDVLTRDLYRPVKVAGLFSDLFPNEHFDVFTSPDRVHQVLRRTRQCLKSEGLPVEIMESEGTYSLRITGPLAISIPLYRKKIGVMESHLYKLQSSSGPSTIFTARLAQDRLGLSKAMVSKFLHWAVENGKLERLGSTNRTISYRIVADAAESHLAAAS